jgi:hypothetical protein
LLIKWPRLYICAGQNNRTARPLYIVSSRAERWTGKSRGTRCGIRRRHLTVFTFGTYDRKRGNKQRYVHACRTLRSPVPKAQIHNKIITDKPLLLPQSSFSFSTHVIHRIPDKCCIYCRVYPALLLEESQRVYIRVHVCNCIRVFHERPYSAL